MAGISPIGSYVEENIGLDLLFCLRGHREAPSEVIVVAIDEVSSDHLSLPLKPGKWPRVLHARLIDNLVKRGASVITFDIFFNETRSSSEDAVFAEAIRNADRVVLCASLKTDKKGIDEAELIFEREVPPILPLAESAAACAPFPLPIEPVEVKCYWPFKTSAGDVPTLPVVTFQIFSLQVYDEFIQLLRNVSPSTIDNLPWSKEELIRTKQVKNFIRITKNMFEKEPLIARKMLKHLRDSRITSLNEKRSRLLKSLVRMYQGPDNQYLNFYGPPRTLTTISYYQLLEPQAQIEFNHRPLDFNGKAVFIGSSAQTYSEQIDGYPTVFTKGGYNISGVEIAATAFANLLEDRAIHPLGPCAYTSIFFLWGCVAGICCSLFSPFIAMGGVVAMGILFLLSAVYQFGNNGTWFPLVIPLFFQTPLAFFAIAQWKYLDTNREREDIKKVLKKIVPGDVVEDLVKNLPRNQTIKKMLHGICLFTDAEDYTSLSETIGPEELSIFINKYFKVVFTPIEQHGGTVIDVKGDSILAIWAGRPSDSGLMERACSAALGIETALHQFNQCSEIFILPTRIGLHSGEMLLGIVGARDHMEVRVLGDTVNTASRIEGLNKTLGTKILISKEVLSNHNGFLVREVGRFLLAGKAKPVEVYELLCRIEETQAFQKDLCEVFSEGLTAFRRSSWKEAIEKFNHSMKIKEQDGPSLFYLELCKKYRENSPGGEWNGMINIRKNRLSGRIAE
ncbi:MAG: CHASE2 domain-containing protein [bacterium]